MINKIISMVMINTVILHILYRISLAFPDFRAFVFVPSGNISFELYIWLGFIFWMINDVLRSIVKVITLPITRLTLWIFSILINVWAFYLLMHVVNALNLWVGIELWSFLQVFLISIVVGILNLFFKKM